MSVCANWDIETKFTSKLRRNKSKKLLNNSSITGTYDATKLKISKTIDETNGESDKPNYQTCKQSVQILQLVISNINTPKK